MMLLSNISSPFIPGPLSQQMSVIDLFLPGFTNITSAASQALSGNWTIYTQLMCVFALAAFLKPYVLHLTDWFTKHFSECSDLLRQLQAHHYSINNLHQDLGRNLPYGAVLDLIPWFG